MDDGTASVATTAVRLTSKAASSATPSASKAAPRKPPARKPVPPGSNGRPAAQPDPMAPRLRQSGTPPERQVLERELRRMRARLSELEKRVSETEHAVKELEGRMAAPGFYDDRDRAAQAAEEHQALMWETGDLMAQWEALQAEVDETSGKLSAAAPHPRR
jgi:ATP-binding cassette subfamily F protein 3